VIRIHDYRLRCWGHDFIIKPHSDPAIADITGWGHGLHERDLLILPHQDGGACFYGIETLRWANNVDDMWFAACRFVPGSSELGQRVAVAIEARSEPDEALLDWPGRTWILDA
jgi:hypothetical protein